MSPHRAHGRERPLPRGSAKHRVEDIRDLIDATDKVAKIHNTLRVATRVTSGKVDVVAVHEG